MLNLYQSVRDANLKMAVSISTMPIEDSPQPSEGGITSSTCGAAEGHRWCGGLLRSHSDCFAMHRDASSTVWIFYYLYFASLPCSLPKAALRLPPTGSSWSCSLLQGVVGLVAQPQGVFAHTAIGCMICARCTVQVTDGVSGLRSSGLAAISIVSFVNRTCSTWDAPTGGIYQWLLCFRKQ